MNKLIGTVAGFTFALSLACGPTEQAKTVTNTDTTTSGHDGTSQTKTTDTQVTSSDGSKESTHTENIKQQPAK